MTIVGERYIVDVDNGDIDAVSHARPTRMFQLQLRTLYINAAIVSPDGLSEIIVDNFMAACYPSEAVIQERSLRCAGTRRYQI